jgi:hypothetical protein
MVAEVRGSGVGVVDAPFLDVPREQWIAESYGFAILDRYPVRATRGESVTGQRYIHHQSMGSSVLLFARPTVKERVSWYLGPASCVSHERERPTTITWRQQIALPEHLYNVMAAAVA